MSNHYFCKSFSSGFISQELNYFMVFKFTCSLDYHSVIFRKIKLNYNSTSVGDNNDKKL